MKLRHDKAATKVCSLVRSFRGVTSLWLVPKRTFTVNYNSLCFCNRRSFEKLNQLLLLSTVRARACALRGEHARGLDCCFDMLSRSTAMNESSLE